MTNLIKLGTNYGGWLIPENCDLNEDSIIYSGGVGEDVSFDVLLNAKYNCNIFLIDPTAKALKHYYELKEFYSNNKPFTGGIQKDYYEKISNIKPNFDKLYYENIGLWDKQDTLKFYKQNNPNHVSQSIIENMFGNNYDVIQVDTISSIMKKYNHTKIDLLKLDIEGAEIKVLENMLEQKIFPKYLCIEFDLKLKHKDYNNDTEKLIYKLQNHGYKILVNDNLNITFELNP
jgi:FkbM family methyltransferase